MRLSTKRFYSGYIKKHFVEEYGYFANGKYCSSPTNNSFNVLAPATGETICRVANLNAKEVNNVIEVAQTTFESGIWSRSDVRERAKVLNKIAENLRLNIPRLAEMEVLQTGRAVREMKAQLARLPEWYNIS